MNQITIPNLKNIDRLDNKFINTYMYPLFPFTLFTTILEADPTAMHIPTDICLSPTGPRPRCGEHALHGERPASHHGRRLGYLILCTAIPVCTAITIHGL